MTARNTRRLILVAALGAFAVGGVAFLVSRGPAIAQMMGHGMRHGQMHGHGAGGGGHDMANMPGLQGLNSLPHETEELAVMFRNFQTFSRTVEETPNGIRTVTSSSDPEVMDALVSHVFGMIARREAGDDPQIFIQSPTLDIFFARPDGIETTIDVTDEGIVVIQTSDDPELVKAMHTHAAEVSDMAARGMAAVHNQMMRRAGN